VLNNAVFDNLFFYCLEGEIGHKKDFLLFRPECKVRFMGSLMGGK
jgi:hypothetical protein